MFAAHDQTERQNLTQLMGNPNYPYLSGGLAGGLLMQTERYAVHPTAERRARLEQLLQALINAIQKHPLEVNLWSGLVGILYAFEFVRASAPEILPAAVADFVDEMDAQLGDYIRSRATTLHFDLISGVAGIGAYALMRTNLEAARNLYAIVEASLVAMSTRTTAGRTWHTQPIHLGPLAPASARANGHTDLGIAHGLPGVVLLLAGAHYHGLGTSATPGLLQEAVAALLEYQSDPVKGSRYSYYTSQKLSQASRLGWCYGDLSAGFALHGAATALVQPALASQAHEIVLSRLAQPEASFGFSDNTLCHGHGGALHMVHKLNAAAPAPRYAEFLRTRLDLLGDGRDHYALQPGLLEGSCGVLLAMEDRHSRGRHHWDVCLTFGF
ncbi:lanthionine synthetase LanC family protein [Pseudoduganella sp. R-32]|uniref:lanthionine synthetase LanC family protein n=1 Tax=Pseudoduganella sp. R-32 TaxID=3404061 RepID=UPI003CE9388E